MRVFCGTVSGRLLTSLNPQASNLKPQLLVCLLAALAPLYARAVEPDVQEAVERLINGQPPDERGREVFRRLHEQWLESEQLSARPGERALGRALKTAAEGRLPDEAATSALAAAYYRGRREPPPETPASPAAPPPQVSEAPMPPRLPYYFLPFAFVAGIAAGIGAFIVKRALTQRR